MCLEARAFRIAHARDKRGRHPLDRHHVRFQLRHIGACQHLVRRVEAHSIGWPGAKAIVEPDTAIFSIDSRIEGGADARARSDKRAVCHVHASDIAEMPCRLIAHSNAYGREPIEVVEVVASIGTLDNIRSCIGRMLCICGIVPTRIDRAFIAPAREVVHRRRPRDVIADAVALPACCIMAAVHIEPVAEDMRLAVRRVLPAREIRIHDLTLSHCLLLMPRE